MRILVVFTIAKHSIFLTNPKLFKYFCHEDHFIKKKNILIFFSKLPHFPDLFVQLVSCNIRWGIHQGWTNQPVLRMEPPDALNCPLGMPLPLLPPSPGRGNQPAGAGLKADRAVGYKQPSLDAAHAGGAGVPRE